LHPATSKAPTSKVPFRLCANTDPQRDSMVAVRKDSPKARPTCSTTPPAKSPAAANSASTRRRISHEGFKHSWPPLIKMDAAVKAKVEKLFNP